MNNLAGQEGGLPLHIMIDITRASADLQHLLMLNQILTDAAESGQEMGSRDHEALLTLENNFQDQLAMAERHVYSLKRFFGSYSESINEILQSKFAGELDSQTENVKRILAVENGNFSERGIALTEMFIQQYPMERDKIRKKLFILQADEPIFLGPQDGTELSLSPSTACTVGGLVTMACLLGCPKTAGIACVCAFIAGALVIHYCS